MKKTEFYFDSRNGKSKIHALRYLPEESELKDGKPVAILQIVHGMSEHVERYEEVAQFFTRRGFLVTGEDHLGHGKSVADGEVFGYFCEQDPVTVAVRDVHRLKKMTQNEYPGIPYFILGHSMGSFMLRNYICRYGTGIQGAVIVGTGDQSPAALAVGKTVAGLQKVFCGGKHISIFLDKQIFGAYNQRIENPHTKFDWLSKNAENVERYLADPYCGFPFTVNGFQTLFGLLAEAGKKENLKKIPTALPLLLLSGAEDPVGGYGEGVKKVHQSLAELGMEHLSMKLYEGDRHEILQEDDRQDVMEYIYRWLCEQLVGGTE